jgi:hypothetical protein
MIGRAFPAFYIVENSRQVFRSKILREGEVPPGVAVGIRNGEGLLRKSGLFVFVIGICVN